MQIAHLMNPIVQPSYYLLHSVDLKISTITLSFKNKMTLQMYINPHSILWIMKYLYKKKIQKEFRKYLKLPWELIYEKEISPCKKIEKTIELMFVVPVI